MVDQSEASSYVELTDIGVTYHRADGISRTVKWDDLRTVLIETTDEGPLVEDVWWILIDVDGHCIIPQEVGSEPLLQALQRLPGFNNDAVIAAMGSVENKRFVCWQRQ